MTPARMSSRLLISIHALLAESDHPNMSDHPHNTDFYPRSPCGERRRNSQNINRGHTISIHALLAESDGKSNKLAGLKLVFLSTLSLRRATESQQPSEHPTTYFYPRSPCGERLRGEHHANSQQEFLSTLSLRRATANPLPITSPTTFLSTLSLRRATVPVKNQSQGLQISIHALLAESDLMQLFISPPPQVISIHALLAESDLLNSS